ncbi:MAG TPA: hypothetical protein VG013_09050 [Gemmataceae bacterium]|nr:hypothetical protein [Gemmataceae bacterium]
MDDLDLPHEVTLTVISVDEHLIEVEAVVGAGPWRGRARAYTVLQDIGAAAKGFQRFTDGAAAATEFAAGADTGIGLVALRFYRIDRAGHIACHIRLASGGVPTEHRPEEVARLSVEVRTEAWAVGQFARQLGEMARVKSGQASLAIEANG